MQLLRWFTGTTIMSMLQRMIWPSSKSRPTRRGTTMLSARTIWTSDQPFLNWRSPVRQTHRASSALRGALAAGAAVDGGDGFAVQVERLVDGADGVIEQVGMGHHGDPDFRRGD